MKKKTWGIILVVIALAGVLGGVANGSLTTMEPIPMVGFFGAVAVALFFGIKFIIKDK